jgi:hypothetical protein
MQILKAGLLFLVMMRVVFSMRRVSSGKFEDFSWQGQPFAVHFQRDKFKITGLTLRIPIADKLRFMLRREKAFDRIARALGIASEWQTGDAGFDDRVFILSEDVAFNQALTRDRELRDLSRTLLASGTKRPNIECRGGMLYLGFATDEIDGDGTVEVVARFSTKLGQLVKLRDGLQRIRAQSWHEDRDPSLTRKATLVGICLALGIAGIVALLFDLGVDWHQVVRENIPLVATWITIGVVGAAVDHVRVAQVHAAYSHRAARHSAGGRTGLLGRRHRLGHRLQREARPGRDAAGAGAGGQYGRAQRPPRRGVLLPDRGALAGPPRRDQDAHQRAGLPLDPARQLHHRVLAPRPSRRWLGVRLPSRLPAG